jgi:hypothetical protein
MRIRCEHVIPLPADAFWELIHAPRYEAAVAEAVGLRAYRELERREEPDAVYRRLQVEADLPEALGAVLRRLGVAGPIGYVEEQWRQRERREVRWRMTPGALAERARIEGVVRVEPRGAGRCARVLDGVIELRVFGVGGMLERAAASFVTDAYAKGAAVAAEVAAAE